MSNIRHNTDIKSTTLQKVELNELAERKSQSQPLIDGNIDVIKNVNVKLEVRVGEAELTVSDIYALRKDSVVKLDRDADEPVDLMLDGRVIARGTLVVSGDNFGICITEISP